MGGGGGYLLTRGVKGGIIMKITACQNTALKSFHFRSFFFQLKKSFLYRHLHHTDKIYPSWIMQVIVTRFRIGILSLRSYPANCFRNRYLCIQNTTPLYFVRLEMTTCMVLYSTTFTQAKLITAARKQCTFHRRFTTCILTWPSLDPSLLAMQSATFYLSTNLIVSKVSLTRSFCFLRILLFLFILLLFLYLYFIFRLKVIVQTRINILPLIFEYRQAGWKYEAQLSFLRGGLKGGWLGCSQGPTIFRGPQK